MNINDLKYVKIDNKLLPDLGIMMSYGIGEDLVSMGIFFVEGYYNSTGKKIDKLPLDKSNIEVKFIEYEFADNLYVRKKENGNRVYMPYDKAQELYGDNGLYNYDKAQEISSKYEGREMIANFYKELKGLYKEFPEFIHGGISGFESRSLESLEGIFISSDGQDMGIDFRVFPFLYNMIRRKYLDKNNSEIFNKYELYNYIYELSNEKGNKSETYMNR